MPATHPLAFFLHQRRLPKLPDRVDRGSGVDFGLLLAVGADLADLCGFDYSGVKKISVCGLGQHIIEVMPRLELRKLLECLNQSRGYPEDKASGL